MQQAGRVSDTTGFFNLAGVGQPGRLVEMGPTDRIFTQPTEQATEDYISGTVRLIDVPAAGAGRWIR